MEKHERSKDKSLHRRGAKVGRTKREVMDNKRGRTKVGDERGGRRKTGNVGHAGNGNRTRQRRIREEDGEQNEEQNEDRMRNIMKMRK